MADDHQNSLQNRENHGAAQAPEHRQPFTKRKTVGAEIPEPLPMHEVVDQIIASQFLKAFRRKPEPTDGERPMGNQIKPENPSFFLEPLDPPPPLWLIVTPKEQGFHLRWESPAQENSLSYRVLRKPDSVPWEENEGEILADRLEGNEMIDSQVPPGVRWFYAVFSFRGSVPSLIPCRSGPHERIPKTIATAQNKSARSQIPLLKKEKMGRMIRNLVSFLLKPVIGGYEIR